MIGFTRKQLDTLDFIRSYVAANRIAPTTGEIATGVGLASKSGVIRLLDALEERGAITRMRGRTRAIEIVGDAGISDAAHHLRLLLDVLDRGYVLTSEGPEVQAARAFLAGRPN